MIPVKIFLALLITASLLFATAGCGTINTKTVKRDEVTDNFRATLRFSEYNGLTGFMASEYLQENPITRLEVNRLNQFRVSSYQVMSVVAAEDGNSFTQTVLLGMVNNNTATERQVQYVEHWKWHEDISNWRLHSGLPDVGNY